MNEQKKTQQMSNDGEIPRQLLDDLAALYDRRIDVPREIDSRIRKAAWQHFARKQRRWVPAIRWIAPLAAAAVVTLMIMTISRDGARRTMAPSSTPLKATSRTVSRDVDGDDRFDIIDALALAQELESGRDLDMRWDANGDGAVDGSDVDALGQNAVALY